MAQAYVSLITSDDYADGALALAQSLRESGTDRKLVLMATKNVSQWTLERCRRIWDQVRVVDRLDSGDAANLALIGRPELGVTLTKLYAWTLVDFQKCVFLDADTLVVANVDALFDRPELSAAPDRGWPDCFNSGVFVYQPSIDTFKSLLELQATEGSFDGGDQGLLNTYFTDWATDAKRLPFIYNVSASSYYQYPVAYKRFADQIKILHFLGPAKPWHQGRSQLTDDEKRWWEVRHRSEEVERRADEAAVPASFAASTSPSAPAQSSTHAPDLRGFAIVQAALDEHILNAPKFRAYSDM